jgi:hypothetical protein
MLVIGISGKKNQGKSRTAVALASRFKRCLIISVYDIVKLFRDYTNEDERDALTEQIRQVCGNYLVDSLKIRIAMVSNLYNVIIIDDIFDSVLMNQIKTELNAQIIGVEKPSLHSLPLMIRDNTASGILGEPDYIVRFNPNFNELSKELDGLMAVFKEKGVIAQ